MDPESAAFQPRDDGWRFQAEMLRVQQSQAELADRVSRLERRQEEDTRPKNPWGASSPFPSVLGGTPQQVPLQQPTAQHFSSFDDPSSSLIRNLQLDADYEPRRIGTTSRANSVRFDETADHGHWSRSSIDLVPRTGSVLGGHAMSERSYSHKSDGRQSSAGHSVHSATSGRANSLTGYGPTTPVEPPGVPAGFSILGPVPAIIRCWLDTDFKHDTLLYAVVASGSYASYLDSRLIDGLGFQDRITESDSGPRKIKLPVYLPEAVPMSASSRSSSGEAQLPYLSVDFTVIEHSSPAVEEKSIQIFLGSDVLQAHNADILFSTNHLTLYDEDGSKLQMPLVRPEDERTFKSLGVSNGGPHVTQQKVYVDKEIPPTPASTGANGLMAGSVSEGPAVAASRLGGSTTSTISDHGSVGSRPGERRPLLGVSTGVESKDVGTSSSPASAASRSGTSPAIWDTTTSWRRDSDKPSDLGTGNAGKDPTSLSQRRDTNRKVLKPMKTPSRSVGNGAQSSPFWGTSGQSRFFDDGKRRVSNEASNEAVEPLLKRSVSGEKAKETTLTPAKTRSANPIGSATAFEWMKNGGKK